MNTVKKIALLVVIFSIAVGSVFGFLVRSGAGGTGQRVSFAASSFYVPGEYSCSPILGNYSDWLQLYVIGNRTSLNLNTVTIYDSDARITLTMPLNSTASAYVSYDPINDTFEALSLPLPSYWGPNVGLDISLSYYFSGNTPQTYSIGTTPIFQKSSITC